VHLKRSLPAVMVAGTLIAIAIAVASGLPARDSLLLATLAGVGAVGAGLLGIVVMNSMRSRSIALLSSFAAVTTVAAVAIGAFVASGAMFISSHDLSALAVILVASATIGIAFALVLGQRVSEARRSLAETTRRIGKGDFSPSNRLPAPAEFALLADELEDMSARLKHAQERERALEASRRELVAWVSHDLRTPLAALRGYLETLLMKEGTLSDQERRNYLEIATRQGERLTTLVARLFELAKLEGGQIEPNREAFQLGDLIEDVVQKFGLATKQHEVEIHTEIPGDDPFVLGDIGLIERVLENLIENALRHTPAGGRILLALVPGEKKVTVEINDTGAGIAQEDLPHIFNRFYRGDKSRRQHTGNAGLGLAIVKSILVLHGSEIDVTSSRGKGASFKFALPVAEGSALPRGEVAALL